MKLIYLTEPHVREGLDHSTRNLPTVLMIGGAAYATRFIADLSKQIRATGCFTLSSLGLGDPDAARSQIESGTFTHQFMMPPELRRPRTLRDLNTFIRAVVGAAVVPEPSWAIKSRAQVRRPFRQILYRRLRAGQCRSVPGLFSRKYDIYHYHTLESSRLWLLWLLPADAKVVLSVWGSDLLDRAGALEYADQLAACERANIITVSSIEIREVLLAKFGRHLLPKVRFALLGVSLLDEIDRWDNRNAFLESSGLPFDRVTICIGNNATPNNRHLDVIHRLSRLPDRHRSQIALLVPLSYRAADPTYKKSLETALERAAFPYRIFEHALSDAEVAMFRRATDILIHVPTCDAFSAAMLETLYAGGLLITGAWLPYSELRRMQISFDQIHALDDLTTAVTSVLDNLDAKRRAATDNPRRVRSLVHPVQTARKWAEIYQELLRD